MRLLFAAQLFSRWVSSYHAIYPLLRLDVWKLLSTGVWEKKKKEGRLRGNALLLQGRDSSNIKEIAKN